jgi:hypothetical protein
MAKQTHDKSIGQILMAALTADQVAALVTAVLPSGGRLDGAIEALEATDADLAATLRAICRPGGASGGNPSSTDGISSLQRDLERWEALWQTWGGHVLELGDEEGTYAFQDNHWEPPEFDGYELASDLEAVAGQMLPLVERVYSAVDEPDLFTDALDNIEAGIAAYPEWMGAEYGEGCCFMENVTRCILHWGWLGCADHPGPGAAFVQKVLAIEAQYYQVSLDAEATIRYFAALPDAVCREIYDLLHSGEDGVDLESVHSLWHRINHEYESRFDSGRHLASCATHLSENWRYGRPLVEKALADGESETAESWLKKTFASLLHPTRKSDWLPETSLLAAASEIRIGITPAEAADLLNLWAEAAAGAGNERRSATARFQAAVFREPEDWDAVFKAFKDTAGTTAQSITTGLLSQWKTMMADRSMRYYLDRQTAPTWVHWLIDAAIEPVGGRHSFQGLIADWLNTLKAEGHAFEKNWRWLALLTTDLDDTRCLEAKFPCFCRAVIPVVDRVFGVLDEHRRQALKRLGAEDFLGDILAVWETRLHRIMPDPARAHKYNYGGHAAWAAALKELNPSQFEKLMGRWRAKHKRRRNLWRDLKAQGLPI